MRESAWPSVDACWMSEWINKWMNKHSKSGAREWSSSWGSLPIWVVTTQSLLAWALLEKLIKPPFLNLQKLRQRWPRQGAPLPRVSFCSRLQPHLPEAGAGEPGSAGAIEQRDACSRAAVLFWMLLLGVQAPGNTAIDFCTADTKAHATWDLERHCDGQSLPGPALGLCSFQRRQPTSWLGTP